MAERIGYSFSRADLATEALTHRGALDRRPDLKAAFPHGNERLEFLGDRVLSLAMAGLLLRRHPDDGEGGIARRHAELVSARVLGEIAVELGLARLRVASDSAPPPTASMLADMLEALLGAIYLDGGLGPAEQAVERLWGPRIASTQQAPRPPKTRLQEWAQGKGLALPAYREVSRTGSEHQPVFMVEVKMGKHGSAQGSGPTKRAAESAAAAAMIAQLGLDQREHGQLSDA